MKNLKFVLDFESDKNFAECDNFYGFLFVEFLVWNYDGKGGAIVLNENGKTSCIDVSAVELITNSLWYKRYNSKEPIMRYPIVNNLDVYFGILNTETLEMLIDQTKVDGFYEHFDQFYVIDDALILEFKDGDYLKVTKKGVTKTA